MKAIRVEGDQLVWANAERPELGAGEVRIRVAATAINRADLVQRQGGYPPPPGASPILGLECAGTVIEVGEGVTRVAPGDGVCALLSGGGYAEEVVVAAGQVLPIPEGLSFAEAAALPEVFATAYLNLYMEAGLVPGERVLIHAAASGVGTAAIQLLKATGNPCFATAGGAEKIDRCRELGAAGGADRHTETFWEEIEHWAGESGVDVILDPVGAAYFSNNFKVLGVNGRVVLIGLMGGVQVEANLAVLMMKRARLIGSTLRARSIAAKSTVMDALATHVWPEITRGAIRPIIDGEYPIEEAGAAHERVASNETFGKVVLHVTPR